VARGKRRATRGEASAPVTPTTLGPARRASRASLRERRRRQRRRMAGAGVVTAVAVVVALIAIVVAKVVTKDAKPPPPKQRTQRTLLLSVTGSSGAARASTLLAYDPEPRRAALVLIPPHTLADVAGIGNVVLANALRLGGPTVTRETVSDLMGVLVDNDWTLTSEAFAALVDRVGGVVVDVDTDVVVNGPKNTSRILVRAGPAQRLDGATALAYATYVGKGQDEITFQARFQGVFEALLAALPADEAEMTTRLSALGPGSRLSWTPPELAAFLAGIRTAHAEDRYEPQVLPVSSIDTGGGTTTFSIKVDDVATLVRNQLADSIPPNRDAGDNRVLVLNGVGTPGLGTGIARRLRGEFTVVGTRNKQGFGVTESVVVVFDSTDESRTKATRVATLLGLRPEAVRIGTQQQSVADVIVVIGSDYKP
jgi:anionic cell wall polymer biosynthesis LytR-Cps2A-Psr (LCP) family protein